MSAPLDPEGVLRTVEQGIRHYRSKVPRPDARLTDADRVLILDTVLDSLRTHLPEIHTAYHALVAEGVQAAEKAANA